MSVCGSGFDCTAATSDFLWLCKGLSFAWMALDTHHLSVGLLVKSGLEHTVKELKDCLKGSYGMELAGDQGV